ncbi:LppU/SCO3897 family protein [Nocardia wallacei]|uniref:LppU/SCO3897 family protein n=1 Tax=Nocardia wallacei TaxID=480035 RepID=UPI002458CEC0|nr:hypothetical protein [Nocardia wallacei]
MTRPDQSHSVPDFAAANGVYCAYCGATPAAHVDFRGHRGMLIVMQFLRQPGPFCRNCGLSTYRRMTVESAWVGWWGFLSFVINPITMLINLPARSKVAALAPPIPGSPRQPMDPGKPLLRRPAALGLLLPVAAVLTIVVGVLVSSGGDHDQLATGDCVDTRDHGAIRDAKASELVKIGCSDPAAQAKIVARLDNTHDTFKCRQYSEANEEFTDSDDRKYFVLCVRTFS